MFSVRGFGFSDLWFLVAQGVYGWSVGIGGVGARPVPREGRLHHCSSHRPRPCNSSVPLKAQSVSVEPEALRPLLRCKLNPADL